MVDKCRINLAIENDIDPTSLKLLFESLFQLMNRLSGEIPASLIWDIQAWGPIGTSSESQLKITVNKRNHSGRSIPPAVKVDPIKKAPEKQQILSGIVLKRQGFFKQEAEIDPERIVGAIISQVKITQT